MGFNQINLSFKVCGSLRVAWQSRFSKKDHKNQDSHLFIHPRRPEVWWEPFLIVLFALLFKLFFLDEVKKITSDGGFQRIKICVKGVRKKDFSFFLSSLGQVILLQPNFGSIQQKWSSRYFPVVISQKVFFPFNKRFDSSQINPLKRSFLMSAINETRMSQRTLNLQVF